MFKEGQYPVFDIRSALLFTYLYCNLLEVSVSNTQTIMEVLYCVTTTYRSVIVIMTFQNVHVD